MSDFVRWLLGLKQAPDWVSGGSWHIEFHSLPQGIWAVALSALAVLAVVGVWYLYKSEVSTVRLPMRIVLTTLRAMVLLCVAFMLLELVLVITKSETVNSRLLVLVDTSQSMNVTDPYRAGETMELLASKLEAGGI